MKSKIKKILTSTILSAVSITAIGCSSGNTKLAKNIDNGMAEFVSSINKLDYVDTSSSTHNNNKIGKIVETSTNDKFDKSFAKIKTEGNQTQFFNNQISELEIENTITRPEERDDNFKLFVLSESPYISLTSDDNVANMNINIKFSTDKIEKVSDNISSKINKLILKRSILMIYVNELYNNNVNLTNEDKVAINAYVNVIKENASYLKGNRGMVKNQLNLANNLVEKESNENLINYYIIKSGEALETRSSKIDSTISAIDSIIEIIENNLTTSSPYYDVNLNDKYDEIIENIDNSSVGKDIEIDENSSNIDIADSIIFSLNVNKNKCCDKNSNNIVNSKNNSTQVNSQNSNNQTNNKTNRNNQTNQIIQNKNNNSLTNQTNNNQMNNLNNKQTFEDDLSNNMNNTIKNNNVRKKQNIITKNDNQTKLNNKIKNNTSIRNQRRNTNNNTNQTNTQNRNQNLTRSVNNMVDRNENNEKYLRADRTPMKSVESEEYEQSKQDNNISSNNATRVPYKINSQF